MRPRCSLPQLPHLLTQLGITVDVAGVGGTAGAGPRARGGETVSLQKVLRIVWTVFQHNGPNHLGLWRQVSLQKVLQIVGAVQVRRAIGAPSPIGANPIGGSRLQGPWLETPPTSASGRLPRRWSTVLPAADGHDDDADHHLTIMMMVMLMVMMMCAGDLLPGACCRVAHRHNDLLWPFACHPGRHGRLRHR